jgi:hypothetical protein
LLTNEPWHVWSAEQTRLNAAAEPVFPAAPWLPRSDEATDAERLDAMPTRRVASVARNWRRATAFRRPRLGPAALHVRPLHEADSEIHACDQVPVLLVDRRKRLHSLALLEQRARGVGLALAVGSRRVET